MGSFDRRGGGRRFLRLIAAVSVAVVMPK